MIGIRVDGNARIGSGHVTRCLAVARQLRARGSEPLFFSVREDERITRAGFGCAALGGVYDDLSAEDPLPALRARGVTTLLVDSYFADAAYFERLAGVRRAAMFDMGDPALPCELLVDYNVNWEDFHFTRTGRLLPGPSYAPLRGEFCGLPDSRTFGRVRSVLLTAGGADPAASTGRILEALRRGPALAGVEIHVVIGGLNPQGIHLREAAARQEGVAVYEDVSNMAELMMSADIAVSAGGTTLYEICACGLPCVTYSAAGNQDVMVGEMQRRGAMLSAGILRTDEARCLQAIVRLVREMRGDAALREALSHRARSLVDGRGAARIAQALMELDVAP
jgi:UDP-2,4-diacetamido-2,4,6-trideoxy-beta-L-altropyranose hydrolase